MSTVKQVIIRDLDECSLEQRVSMKKAEVRSYKRIISRRDKILQGYSKIGYVSEFLIKSTNKLRRELTVAEAELRQLELGIVMS